MVTWPHLLLVSRAGLVSETVLAEQTGLSDVLAEHVVFDANRAQSAWWSPWLRPGPAGRPACVETLGAPGEDTSVLIGGRLNDTAIGAALALLLQTALWPQATSARVPPRQTGPRTVGGVLTATWSLNRSLTRLTERRRQLLADITSLRVVQADALADTSQRTAVRHRPRMSHHGRD